MHGEEFDDNSARAEDRVVYNLVEEMFKVLYSAQYEFRIVLGEFVFVWLFRDRRDEMVQILVYELIVKCFKVRVAPMNDFVIDYRWRVY